VAWKKIETLPEAVQVQHGGEGATAVGLHGDGLQQGGALLQHGGGHRAELRGCLCGQLLGGQEQGNARQEAYRGHWAVL